MLSHAARHPDASSLPEREGDSSSAVTGSRMDGIIRKVAGAADKKQKQHTPSQLDYSDGSDEPVVADDEGERTKPNKHSMDYIIRSGIAGGMAGCAVSCVH